MAHYDRGDRPPTAWEEGAVENGFVIKGAPTQKQVLVSSTPSFSRTCEAALLLVAAFIMIVFGTVFGAKASRVPIFWLVNVASDTFFAIAVAAAARASQSVYETLLTKRINQGVPTPLYLAEGLGPLAAVRKDNRGMRILAWLAAVIVFAQLLADTGLEAEQTFVPEDSDGLIWVAGDNCSPQTGVDTMPMGPYMANGALGLGAIDENEFPLASLAVNIYAGRVPDNGSRVEHVTFAGDIISGSERAYYSASLKPIIEMPRIIPVTKKVIQTYGSYGDQHNMYSGPIFEPHLDAVVENQEVANRIWGVVLVEDVEDDLLDLVNDKFDFDYFRDSYPYEPGDRISERWNGFYYQYPTIEESGWLVELFVLQHAFRDAFVDVDAFGDLNIPQEASVTTLVTVGCPIVDNTCDTANLEITATWRIITESPLPSSTFWPIWKGADKGNGDTLGKGPAAVEDLARVVHAATISCGQVTTGSLGKREVRAVIGPAWFLGYIALWVYVMGCAVVVLRYRNEPYVPIPKTWFDGYQMACCDLGDTSLGNRKCDEPFTAVPTCDNGVTYNIVDYGNLASFDHLGLNQMGGAVTARKRSLHP